jgi:ABC-type nickel/cobalt efflux system permease component RcnA
MFGLDDWFASYSDGAGLAVVALVAIVLGLRHATDPDHLAAVGTLMASKREGAGRRAAALGAAWGIGHALTLFAFGLPVVLFEAYLPERIQQGAELTIGLVIVSLAVLLLVRWRRGDFHAHVHEHGDGAHLHVHSHEKGERARTRSPRSAFGIGLVHGMGGSAGVGVLLVAAIESTVYGVVALAVLAGFTAVSMALLSTGLGAGLTRLPLVRLAPALGALSLAFGVWYSLGALSLAPYSF